MLNWVSLYCILHFLTMEEILGFSKVEYLVAFHAIITGFVASEFFVGGGEVLRQHHTVKSSYLHILFTFLAFSLLLIFWWNIWNRSIIIADSVTDFIRVLPYSLLFYLMTVLLFKELRENRIENLNQHFTKYRILLYTLAGAYFLYDQIDSIDNSDRAFRYLGMAFCLIGIVIRNKAIQLTLLLCGSLVISAYILWSYFNQFFFDNELNAIYSKVEHLSIFLTFLFGFVVAEFLKGWSDMLYSRSRTKFSLTHFLWTLLSFALLIDIWWGSWNQKALIAESLINFLLLLISPFAIYLLSVLFFPKLENQEIIDYQEVFLKNKRYIFPCFAGFFLTNIAISYLFDQWELEFKENIMRGVAVILSIIAWRINNHLFHKILIVTSSILLIINGLLSSN